MRKDTKSFTLIEAVMAIVIAGVLIVALGTFSKAMVIDTYQFIDFRNTIVSRGRLAIYMMAREIRNISDSQSIAVASASQFQFTDVDGNSISYRLNGSNLMRNNNLLCPEVASLQFTYYSRTGQELASPLVNPNKTNIWQIKAVLNVTRGEESKNLFVLVHPRNFFRDE